MKLDFPGETDDLIDEAFVLPCDAEGADESDMNDGAGALRAIQSTLDDAESRQWAANREQALLVVAVGETLAIARRHPHIYVPHRVERTVPDADAARFSERAAIFDLAVRLHLSEQTVRSHLNIAETLAAHLPCLREQFLAGVAPFLQVRSAVEACAALTDPDALARYDKTLADAVGRMAPGPFGTKARKLAEKLSTEPAQVRHARAREERRVEFEPAPAGMAWLHLYIDALDAIRIDARLTRTAVRLRHEKGPTRTKAQLRADAAVAWLAGDGTPTAAIVRPYLVVDGDGGAELQGYGPVDTASAAGALRDAPSFRRLFSDPIRPKRLTVDRATYRPSSAQKEWLTLRFGLDEAATEFMSTDFEMDHVVERQDGGPTEIENLLPFKPRLHRLKSITGITFTAGLDGGIRVTTPTGYDSEAPPF